MARIRTIKPTDLFPGQQVESLSPLARLIYHAAWLEADRPAQPVRKPNILKLRCPHIRSQDGG